MRKSQEVRKKIQELKDQLVSLNSERGASWNDDDQKKWDETQAQIRSMQLEAERFEEVEKIEQEKADAEARKIRRERDRDHRSPEEKAFGEFSLLRALSLFESKQPLDGLELEMHQQAEHEAKRSKTEVIGNLLIPQMMIRKMGGVSTRADRIVNAGAWDARRDNQYRAVLVAGTGSLGGNSIQTDLGDLIPFLNPKLMVESLGATILDNLTGNLDLPRKNSRGTASFVSETGAAPETNPTMDMVQLRPKRLAATARYSKTLVRQSSLAVENFVRQDLSEAIAIAWDYHALNGAGGTNQPLGLLNVVGANQVVGGTNGAAFNWVHAVDFETKVAAANANVATMAYLLTTGLVGRAKTTEKFANSGQAIWQTIPQAVGMIGTINEYRAERTTQLPSNLTKGTANGICNAAIFGDWSQLVLASWGPIDLTIDPYTESKNAIVNITVNAWVDGNVLHPESFSIMKDALVA